MVSDNFSDKDRVYILYSLVNRKYIRNLVSFIKNQPGYSDWIPEDFELNEIEVLKTLANNKGEIAIKELNNAFYNLAKKERLI